MDLRFVSPQLRRLDECRSELLACALAEDERPPRGVAGLVDWRLGGRLSRLLASGFVSGAAGEQLLVPCRPKLPFDKVLLVGVGPRGSFDERACERALGQLLATLSGLRTRSAVVELPGRHFDGVGAPRAAELLLGLAGEDEAHDVWTLVEPGDAQRAVQSEVLRDRRRRSG
ncbi:MAG: leucyl aminopeptidase [Polyangiaceae bacterium]|nr:leucyl aminopeptidase [Polyangiaceae bacterium]